LKRFLTGLALFLTASICAAQITATLTTYFSTPKEFQARYLSGSPVSGPYVAGDVDTMQAVQIVGRVVDSVASGATSSAVVDFTVSAGPTGRFFTYRDTLRHSVQCIVPKFDSLGINDSVVYFIMGANTISDGDAFEFVIKEIQQVRLTGDTLTVKADFDISSDSLNTF
jgi:hypothetical protein